MTVGEESELHLVIFDEIDAICKSRGSSRDGTGVGDSVVNQLLSKIDGVDSCNAGSLSEASAFCQPHNTGLYWRVAIGCIQWALVGIKKFYTV